MPETAEIPEVSVAVPARASEAAESAPEAAPGGSSLFDAVVNLCLKRGFVFRSAEIYGGFRSAYDYGPLGVLLLRNVKEQWWRSMVQLRHDVVGLDASILSPPAVWEASGHLDHFTDPMVECRDCGQRHRLDKLEDSKACPDCREGGNFTEPRQFNLMFFTHAGPVAESAAQVYLRPETAQGMFINFANVARSGRKRPPFGIAQIGKSFRNEITPGNFVFRTREFEQMEMEYFVPPEDASGWFEHWCEARMQWYLDLGIRPELLRLRAHDADELSHYSSATSDVEFLFPWGWGELEGVANRGDYDLRCHAERSGERLDVFDPASGEHYVPHVIEPAAGATRAAMAFLMSAYRVETVNDAERVVLGLDHRLAPYQAAVLPLSRKEALVPEANRVFDLIKGRWSCDYDETQAIGRRYRRQDEIGTPLCVTIDFETLEDSAVTVRDRDSMAQDRVGIDRLPAYLSDRLQ
ncbi:MAG: glycine--tRNA ligase [Acidimicrobiaceae bacterium]|nr:glycine--tRNA ligase [Acidimicrobiaceae bacterium]MCY4176554.1 glycine--tRNA ligase [Acidimicrobiaceae bacterium]MCY4294708.1 glycine--tRNA ligase [Acidimicrobiaceae bacterium]